MPLLPIAQQVCAHLLHQPEILRCTLYGSLQNGTADRYSDIDIEIDVSGIDNGQYLFALPAIVAQKFPVLFSDYAPSLAPEKYVVSLAISAENPFLLLDIACSATPHCPSVTRQALSARNDPFTHLLKLFTANLKHFLRGTDCRRDVTRMAARCPGVDTSGSDARGLLLDTYGYLRENAAPEYRAYLSALAPHLPA